MTTPVGQTGVRNLTVLQVKHPAKTYRYYLAEVVVYGARHRRTFPFDETGLAWAKRWLRERRAS
ncbi:MAG: hypothetical protein C4551_10215 [Bacillota bacterium]|jgi:hypothetical protein|nr:MAG: hypothetical protein C4551_10215 [Bacillota bacterium]